MSASTNHSVRRRLRRFGLTVAIGFSLIGALSWWRDHTVAPLVLWTIAAVLAVPAAIAPAILGPVERAWLTLGGWLAWVNTRIILTAVFYLVVTPVGIVMRRFRDPLDRRIRQPRPSYWIPRGQAPVDRVTYERQF